MEFQKPSSPLRGEITVPGDKSISHRAVMFGAISQGTTRITNFLQGADCLSTISCFQKMGISIENTSSEIRIHGKGLHGLAAPADYLDAGNSGTTTRLISGILAGQNFTSCLTGDESIQSRPMGRIITPLSQMGAFIESIRGNNCAPLKIQGRTLHGIHYHSPVASAQVKSCVLLAGLYGDAPTSVTEPFLSRNHTELMLAHFGAKITSQQTAGLYGDAPTSVTEPFLSRNHTELMLAHFGAKITSQQTTATIQPEPTLYGTDISVPGDISSAAYFIAAALLVPGSEVLIKHVGINPTRDGILFL